MAAVEMHRRPERDSRRWDKVFASLHSVLSHRVTVVTGVVVVLPLCSRQASHPMSLPAFEHQAAP